MENKETKKAQKGVKSEKKWVRVLGHIGKLVTAALVVLVLFWFGFVCQVREGNCAVILRFGAVRQEITEAGVYLKLPWPFETVVTYDNRLQYLESNRLETTTQDKRNVILQSYVVWRVNDPVLYHNSVGVQGAADTYINDQVFSATNSTLGTYKLTSLVSLEKEEIRLDEIQEQIHSRVQKVCLENYGIQVEDVSILRLSLPDTNLESVFEQMRTDREKEIEAIIANAQLEANRITMDAAKDAAEIIADGVTQAAEITAQTEAEVAKIYAEAQSANIELYRFLMNLDTMVNSVNNTTVLVVKADEYPFSILTDYSKQMSAEGDSTVISDLTYILNKLPEKDRQALTKAITKLIKDSAKDNGIALN